MKIKLTFNAWRKVTDAVEQDSTSESDYEDDIMSDTPLSQNPFDPDDSDLDVDQIGLEHEEDDEVDDDDAMPDIQSPAKPKFVSSSAFKPPPDARMKDIPKLKKAFVESTWSEQPSEDLHNGFQFTGNACGPTGIAQTPFEVFNVFMDDKIVTFIVQKTNWFIFESGRYKPPRNRPLSIKEVTEAEFWCWLALRLLSEENKRVNIRDNWSTNPLLNCPAFSKTMTLDRFELISQALHFESDDYPDKVDDKMWKIRTLFNAINVNCSQNWNLPRMVSIDESLLLWKGHHSLRRYIANKAAKFGFKIYALADSIEGYVTRMIIDEGKRTRYHPHCPESLNVPGKLVWTLMSENGALDKGHLLATDNYYTDVHLSTSLFERMTDTIRTVRKDRRDLPSSVLKATYKTQGERITKYNGELRLMNWRDSKEVRILSTVGSPEDVRIVKSKPSKNPHAAVKKPELILLYNQAMPGV